MNAVSEAARLALRIGWVTADTASALADVGEGLPWVGGVLTVVRTIRDKVDTAISNKSELKELQERCTYLTACVIVRCRQSSSEIDVSPLVDCVTHVQRVVEGCSRRGRFTRVIKSKEDKDEIAELHGRLGKLTRDMGLAGVVVVEGKVDNLNGLLRQLVDKQDEHHAQQMNELREIKATVVQKNAPAPKKRAQVPKTTPVRQSWHVTRERVQQTVFEGLCQGVSPRIVGLVGGSGSGKTTAAAELVRRSEVLEYFSDGIVWLPVNNGARDRLSSLMWQLAAMVHDDILGSIGPAPAGGGDGAPYYIKKNIGKGKGGEGLRCLVVADDVWEPEVIATLRGTGMWVLVTTRYDDMLQEAGAESVGIDKLSKDDALSVLTRASELPMGTPLPGSAWELVELCGHLVMNLAFVGRWSAVRKREDPSAWSRAVASISAELKALKINVTSDTIQEVQAKRRIAVLRAGFRYLGVENDDVQWLYLALAVVPDGHAFSLGEASVLVYGQEHSPEDEQAVAKVLDILERWSIVEKGGGSNTHLNYRMHDAHANFARESLKDRGDVRRPALNRWTEHISSLGVLTCTNRYELVGLWRVVKAVAGDGFHMGRPYDRALSSMDGSEFDMCRTNLLKVVGFREAHGDWAGAYDVRRRLLELEKQALGEEHGHIANTLRLLADVAGRIGNADEALKWRRQQMEALDAAVARDRSSKSGGTDLRSLQSLATTMMESRREEEAEQLFRQIVKVSEAQAGPDDESVGYALHSLGVCVRRRGRLPEAEELLTRSLSIKMATLGPDTAAVAYTRHNLGMCMRQTGRVEEASNHLSMALEIFEVKLGRDDVKVAGVLNLLASCAKELGRYEEAMKLFARALNIFEAKLQPGDWRVLRSRRQLNRCVDEVDAR